MRAPRNIYLEHRNGQFQISDAKGLIASRDSYDLAMQECSLLLTHPRDWLVILPGEAIETTHSEPILVGATGISIIYRREIDASTILHAPYVRSLQEEESAKAKRILQAKAVAGCAA